MSDEIHVCYGVERGEYSDCETLAVFTTREKAEAYIAKRAAHCWICGSTERNEEPNGDWECSKCSAFIPSDHGMRLCTFALDPEEVTI
jgi:ribosomal protein L37AE/L43A